MRLGCNERTDVRKSHPTNQNLSVSQNDCKDLIHFYNMVVVRAIKFQLMYGNSVELSKQEKNKSDLSLPISTSQFYDPVEVSHPNIN